MSVSKQAPRIGRLASVTLMRWKRAARRLAYRGLAVGLRGDAVHCPCCGRSFRRFASYRGRRNVRCPSCLSLERHRAARLELDKLPRSGRALHVAPDATLSGQLGDRCVSLDLSRRADVQGDLTQAPFADGSFELIVCSHVLEHIPNDAGALAELRRLVAAGGVVLVIVPIETERQLTYEDPSITSPKGRATAFGQWDHVRIYGQDVNDRVRAQDWSVEEVHDGFFLCRP